MRGNLAANAVGILNDARELALFLTEHILANVVRVLTGAPPDGYGWEVRRAEDYVAVLVEIAEAPGGGVVVPAVSVSDCPDHEDNRVLECVYAGRSVLIVSDDHDLLSMSPWRGTPVVTSAEFVKRTDARRRSQRRWAVGGRKPAHLSGATGPGCYRDDAYTTGKRALDCDISLLARSSSPASSGRRPG